mgnify:FL=1
MRKLLEEMQAEVFKALGHSTRVRIVSILAREGHKCVCELVERLGFDQSTVSKHLSVLKVAGIVTSSKQGLNVSYEIAMPCVVRFLGCIKCVAESEPGEPDCASCKALPGRYAGGR